MSDNLSCVIGWRNWPEHAPDRRIHVYDALTGDERRVFSRHVAMPRAVAISHDNERVVSGSEDGQLFLWELLSGKVIGHYSIPGVPRSVAISPDGKVAAIGGSDATVHLWSLPQP
jgi:WD40 repeat protein